MKRVWAVALGIWALGLTVSQAVTTFSVTNNNSNITVDAVPVPGFNYGGLIGWEIDPPVNGIRSHVEQQWYWYRLPGMTREYAVSDVAGGLTYVDSLVSGNQIAASFRTNGLFIVQLEYTLNGGAPGSGQSSLTEVITFRNLTDTPLSLTWFEFDDFDLNYTLNNDTASGGVNGITQVDPSGVTLQVSHDVTPNRYQISSAPGFPDNPIFDDLEDDNVDDLDNSGSPTGPGLIRFAFQWDLELPVGEDYSITVTKLIIPEPTTGLLVAMALAGFGVLARRRR